MSKSTLPVFEPKLTKKSDDIHSYQDGRVVGVVGIHDGATVIYEWSSNFPGHGHTKEALKWLRDHGGEEIIAFNVGMPVAPGETAEAHTAYWIHMKHQGLVSQLVDDEGCYFPVADLVDVIAKINRKPRHAEVDSGPGL